VPTPQSLRLKGPELAADMAALFALALSADVPMEALDDPHHEVAVAGPNAGQTDFFTLHELLCELRSLSWNDRRALPGNGAGRVSGRPVSLSLTGPEGSAGHRRAARWNEDGQLTLKTLFSSGVTLSGRGGLSVLFALDHVAGSPEGPQPLPGAGASLSDWIGWACRHSGAGLALPGLAQTYPRPRTPMDLAERVHDMPAARPFHAVALACLAEGDAFDPGLTPAFAPAKGTPDVSGMRRGARLFALMAEAEKRALESVCKGVLRSDRLSRPAVTAARMTVILAREEQARHQGQDLHLAVEELSRQAPNLLDWMGRANRAHRSRQRHDTSLFLPLGPRAEALHPADCASSAVIAGALGTVLKAMLQTSGRRRMFAGHGVSAPISLGAELDLLVSNLALGRLAGSGYFPAETHQDLRLGETIALQLLREELGQENRSAQMEFVDFDGAAMQIQAHPRHFGRGLVELRRNGTTVDWPLQTSPSAAHLTAVV
jgi:hypothetical protein